MFKNLFGKKNDGFYLQLEDSDATSKPVEKAPAKPAPAAAPKAEPTPAAVTAPASTDKTEDKTDKKAAKAEKKSVKEAAPKAKEAPALVAAPAPVAPPATNFATDYLIKPSSRSTRRMPGANMNGFLEMARQAKKPANIK